MAEQPIGITFMPSAEAAANGPRQAGVEGQGGSDLTQAFKILSLHLPRVLGAAAIAPKRLLTSQGAAGVPGQPSGGFNPYAAVFESLLQSLTGGGGGGDVSSLASLLGGGGGTTGPDLDLGGGGGASGGADRGSRGAPAPAIVPGSDDLPRDGDLGQPPPVSPIVVPREPREPREPRNRYQ